MARQKPFEPEMGPLLSDIRVGDPVPPIDIERVKALAKSMGEIGLMTPIVVDWHTNRDPGECGTDWCDLIAGRHRYEAAKLLGWTRIAAVTRSNLPGGVEAEETPEECKLSYELMRLDENLVRAELTPEQRAEFTRQRVALLERRDGTGRAAEELSDTVSRNRSANRPKQPRRSRVTTGKPPGRPKSTAKQKTARALGVSERTVRRDIGRAEGRQASDYPLR